MHHQIDTPHLFMGTPEYSVDVCMELNKMKDLLPKNDSHYERAHEVDDYNEYECMARHRTIEIGRLLKGENLGCLIRRTSID